MNTSQATFPARAATHESKTTCAPFRCVAMRAVVTHDRPDGDVQILTDTQTIAIADDPQDISELFGAALAGTAEQRVVLSELAAVPAAATTGPMILERLLVEHDGRAVHLEARVLPLTGRERQDLQELLSDTAERDLAHELAAIYTEDIEQEQRAAVGPLPVCFIDQARVPGAPQRP